MSTGDTSPRSSRFGERAGALRTEKFRLKEERKERFIMFFLGIMPIWEPADSVLARFEQ